MSLFQTIDHNDHIGPNDEEQAKSLMLRTFYDKNFETFVEAGSQWEHLVQFYAFIIYRTIWIKMVSKANKLYFYFKHPTFLKI